MTLSDQVGGIIQGKVYIKKKRPFLMDSTIFLNEPSRDGMFVSVVAAIEF